jgi:phage-related protein
VWLSGEVKSPPLSAAARIEAGFLLRKLQAGIKLEMPHSRPMPSIGARCHELRIVDQSRTWRIVYRIDDDAIVITDVFDKTTQATPKHRIEASKNRLKQYDRIAGARS